MGQGQSRAGRDGVPVLFFLPLRFLAISGKVRNRRLFQVQSPGFEAFPL